MSKIEKVAVFGLDCAEPSLMFDQWRDDLPNINSLMQTGTYGTLESCMPPITVPAWSCMASSKDPGTLGIYGFRNRADHSYDKLAIATSLAVEEPRLWDIMDQHGKQSIIVGVPGTYPITKGPNGCMITSFLTPDTNADYTWPTTLKREINSIVDEYMVDVKGFRTDDKQWLLDQIYKMTDNRFKVVRYLLKHKPWDLFFMVEMGVDRIHHGFWAYMDPEHHRYQPGHPFEAAIHDYYVHIDRLIGEALEFIDRDKTAVWIVSDHGAKTMVGGFCFNEWLIRQGYLTLNKPPSPGQKFTTDQVDWSRTKAWGEGGYYGRLFLNVKGREPQGIIENSDYQTIRNELVARIEELADHEGKKMGNRAYMPEDIYDKVNCISPDLVVIFGDLRWRSVGSIGHEKLYSFENDTGPDDANHAQMGLYLYNHPSLTPRGRMDGPTLYDVAPTIIGTMGLPIPDDMKGNQLPTE